MNKDLHYWVPAFVCAVLIFSLSHQSNPPGADLISDRISHFLEYAVFGLTLVWGVTSGFHLPLTSKSVIFVGVIAALYALSDEFHQSFVPNREASSRDLATDVLGAVVCLSVVWVAKKGKWRY